MMSLEKTQLIKIIIMLNFDKIILELKRNKNSKTNFLRNAHVR